MAMLTRLAGWLNRPSLASALNTDAISLNILAAQMGGLKYSIRRNQL